MDIRPRHWLIALVIASLTHAALALALVHVSAPSAIPPPGIIIELGEAGQAAAAGADGSPGHGILQPVASPALTTAAAAAAETREHLQAVTPIEAIIAKSLPALEPEPQPAPRQQQRPAKPTPPPEPVQPPTQTFERNSKQPRPKPKTASPDATSIRAKERESSAQSAPPPPSAKASASGSRDSSRTSASSKGSSRGNRSGNGEGQGESTGKGGHGGDSNTSSSNYYGRLATWLARHKRYPAQARRLRQEGTVKVSFTISRTGRVLSTRIIQSSGYELLDAEVQAMLKRASPLPRIPSSLGRSSLTITLPVAFALR